MIPVIWYKACRGNWDHGVLLSIFEKHPEEFPQFNTNSQLSCFSSKAIVIVAGKPDVDELRDYLQNMFGPKGGIVILTSEEDAYFEWEKAIPSKFEIWTQYYSPSTKMDIKTRLLLGAPLRIRDYKINNLPKKYRWSFVGQVQNPFREECVKVLKTMANGYLREVEMFGGHGKNGMDYQEYLDIMCQSEYVICPAGSMCVDSFRVYEAMECGAIPVTDVRAPRDPEGFDYWHEVYPQNRLITVLDWNWLPEMLPHHTLTADVRNTWWNFRYKPELERKLLEYANG